MISDAHVKIKAAGGDLVKQGWEYVRVQVLGQEAKQPSPQPSRNVSYSSYLMERFAMPSARQGLGGLGVSAPTDIFNLLGKVVQQTTYPDSTSRAAQVDDLAQSGQLIPPSLSEAERNDFITTQRERLATLMQAFDREAAGTPPPPSPRRAEDTYARRDAPYSSGRSSMPRQPSSRKSYLDPSESSYMHKSRSESEFEDLAYEPMPDPQDYRPKPNKRSSQGGGAGSAGWSNWIWGGYPTEKDSAIDSRKRD